MTDATQFREYNEWTGRKLTILRRGVLDCGCQNLGEVFFHLWCDRLACEQHADDPHDCGEYAGVKSGTEEEAPERVEAVPPVPWVQSDTSPLVSFADVAAGPFGGGNPATVDVRRRVQDGSAPIPAAHDHVADALRAEVLRQGLTECEIDGVRWIYRNGEWYRRLRGRFPRPVGNDTVDLTDEPEAGTFMTEEQFDRYVETGIEPGVLLLDASSDTAPDVTVMPADQFDNLMATIDEPDEMPALRRAWWRRWTR